MTVSHSYALTNLYTAVENGGGDITAGTFSIYAKLNAETEYVIATSPPSEADYDIGLTFKGLSFKIELQVGEFLYGRAANLSSATVGVITA